jgi:hypothetical protein
VKPPLNVNEYVRAAQRMAARDPIILGPAVLSHIIYLTPLEAHFYMLDRDDT